MRKKGLASGVCQKGFIVRQDGKMVQKESKALRTQAEHCLFIVQTPFTACNLSQLPPSVPAIIYET